MARSILEARLAVGPSVAALAATRGGPALAALLTGTIDRLAATEDGPAGDVERQVHALEYWDQVVDAADSIVFRLMFNSLRAAYEPALEALAPVMAEEVGQTEAYRLLTAAIAAGDPEVARAAADRVLRPATQHLIDALTALEENVTKASPEIEQLAAERLAADESPAARRRSLSLGEAWSEFVRHPSPWMIGAFLLGSVVARIAASSGQAAAPGGSCSSRPG